MWGNIAHGADLSPVMVSGILDFFSHVVRIHERLFAAPRSAFRGGGRENHRPAAGDR